MTRHALFAATALAAAFSAGEAFCGELEGRVAGPNGDVSLGGAQVEIVELGRRATPGSDGRFRFADVAAGTFTLRATYAGAEPVTSTVVVPESGAASADMTLGAAGGGGTVAQLVVIGQRATLASAVSRQRAADGVSSVLTRDSMGQFPDQNVAEAIRRLPGVNVLNDQGEGRFIAVRGLDPDLNSASINGVRTPAPESDVRSVALDVIPAELIESVEVKKTLTPDMDADTIGASIEINTTSAFDRRKPLTSLKVEGSYNDATGSWSPKASIDFSRNFGDWGVAGGLSYYRRQFATDNVEADGWDEEGGAVYVAELEYRDYDVERERIGGSLSFDFRLSEATALYARLLHSRFDDQEYRRRLIFDMEDAVPNSGDATSANFDSADGERFTVIRDLKDRFERQQITSLSVGGRTHLDTWRFDYSASYAKSTEKENGSIDPGRFRQRFSGSGGSRGTVSFDYSNLGKPQYDFDVGEARFLDPGRYDFYRLERTSLSDAQDEESALTFDATRTFGLAQGSFDIKFGAKARMREKTYDLQLDYYDGYDGDFTLADVLGSSTYDIADIDPAVGKSDFAGFFYPNIADFELSDLDTQYESAVADYGVKEKVYAAYVLGRYEVGPLLAIGGLRVERTDDDLSGNLVELVEEDVIYNGAPLAEDAVFVTPLSFSNAYTDWLPSGIVRFEPREDLVFRIGAYRSVVRPKFGQMAPRFVVEETEDDGREGEFGNPGLDPYRAWNYDLSVEWYFAREAVLSAGFFRKDIEDFIVEAEFKNGTFGGVAYDEAVIPINGDKASATGFEITYQQSLLFLPAPFDGLLVSFNYTYTDAKGDVLGRTIPLPASAENTYNAVLGYEKGPLSLRLAAAYRDQYLDELSDDPDEDRYVKDHLQWDLTAKYRINKKVQVFGELINLGDEPYTAFQRGPGRDRLLQYEEYSWTAKVGARLNF